MRVGTDFITQQGIEQVTTRDRTTGLVYSRPGRISLVTVEREVRVYSLGVSDPMLRFPATSSSAPSSPVSPPPSSLPVSPAPVIGLPEVLLESLDWKTGTLGHWSWYWNTRHWDTGDQCSGGIEVQLDSDGNISDCQVGDGNILDME